MFLIFLAVWTAMHVYLFTRLASIPLVRAHVPTWALILIAVVLWPTYIVGAILSQIGPAGVGRVIEHVGATWIGVLFLSVVCMFAADLLTGFGFLFTRIAPTARAFAMLTAIVLTIIATVQAYRTPVISSYEVQLKGLPVESDGMVLVLASDLHAGTILRSTWLEERVAQINGLKPDVIVLAGDILQGDEASRRELLPTFRKLSAPLGVWAVTGNHEYYSGIDLNLRLLEEAGMHVLRDRWEEARPGLIFAGVDDLTARPRPSRATKFIPGALAGRPEGATILLSHTPREFEEASAAGVGLMLSGHTHNGQIWPFTYVVRKPYPNIQGRYQKGQMVLIVSRGMGTWGPRMRLWQRSEVIRITLRRA